MIADEAVYRQVERIKRGLAGQHPLFAGLTYWLNERFDYRVLCCGYYRERVQGDSPYTINRLDIYAHDRATYERMRLEGFGLRESGKSYPNETETLNYFRELLDKHRILGFPWYRNPTVYSTLDKARGDKLHVDVDRLFAIGHSFEEAYRGRLVRSQASAIKGLILDAFPDVKVFKVDCLSDCIYVFYDEAADQARYDGDGTTERIRETCNRYLQGVDEFGALRECPIPLVTESDERIRTVYGSYANYYR